VLPALVLTAGLGTRLDPLTRLIAKPAVPIAGRTLIERALDWLRSQGVSNVVLNLHHHPASITSVVGDGRRLGLDVRYSWEDPILGSAGGPRHALALLDADPFLIVNGDTLCDVDLAPMIDAHERNRAAVTMAVVPNPAPDHYNGIVIDAAHRVTAFVPKGSAQPTWHFVGIQIVSAGILAPLPDGVPAETVAGIYRDRVASGDRAIFAWPVTNQFVDVGTPRDYIRTALGLAGTPGTGDATSVIEGNGDLIDPTARIARSVIWPDVRISAGVVIEDSIVTSGLTVPRGFTSRRSMLLPSSVVRDGEHIERAGDIAVFPLLPSAVDS
jgi:mannose-1-phosphate guanylyltransferase